MEGAAATITSAVTSMVSMVTTNIFPLVTKEPFVYFLAIALIGGCCGIFARLRRSVH